MKPLVYNLPTYQEVQNDSVSPPVVLPMENQIFYLFRENLHVPSMTNENCSGTINDICVWFIKYREWAEEANHIYHLRATPHSPPSFSYKPSQLDTICKMLGLIK